VRTGSRQVDLAPGEFPVLLGYAAIAIYGCVPETDQMPTIGWMVAGLLAIELVTRSASAIPVQIVGAGIVLWSGLSGAAGRGSAVVGAWFAFWPLVLVIASALVFGLPASRERWLIGLVGGLAAVGVARTGGIEPETAPAVLAVAVAAPVSIGVSWAVVRISARTGAVTIRR
jgi:hypothetical protein